MAARLLAGDPRLPLLHDHRPEDDPGEPRGARVYAVGVGLLATLLIAPQTTEFATKVAILGALFARLRGRGAIELFRPRRAAARCPRPAASASAGRARGSIGLRRRSSSRRASRRARTPRLAAPLEHRRAPGVTVGRLGGGRGDRRRDRAEDCPATSWPTCGSRRRALAHARPRSRHADGARAPGSQSSGSGSEGHRRSDRRRRVRHRSDGAAPLPRRRPGTAERRRGARGHDSRRRSLQAAEAFEQAAPSRQRTVELVLEGGPLPDRRSEGGARS